MRTMAKPREFIRFSPIRRVEHALVVVAFFMLVVTGIPQRFYESSWAITMVDWMGGLAQVRMLHRLFGIVFTVQFALHILHGLWIILIKRRTPAIAPNFQDVRDAILSFQNVTGSKKKEPKFGHFEFRQKFEYWGMIVGGSLMITTGLVLMNPTLLATFFPSELIPLSRVAHSNEAFLAFLVILFWHLYSVTLNPEVFPLDTSIFTGRISQARMKHEHPLEYEALVGTPPPEEKPTPKESCPEEGTGT